MADYFIRRRALPEIKLKIHFLFFIISGAGKIHWNYSGWVWTLELNVELERWTNSLILHRLVVELRLWVLRKWEEELLHLGGFLERGRTS